MKWRGYITGILSGLMLAAVCTGCGTEAADYYNRADPSYNWFTLGDIIYTGSVFSVRTQYHANFDAPLVGLCRDPLCTHDGAEALCPDHKGFNSIPKSYCTDGKNIYFLCWGLSEGTAKTRIFSLPPDGTALHLLTEFEYRGGGSSFALRYYDDYLYYQNSIYKEDTGEESITMMRISTSGGTPEEVLTQRFAPGILHFVDGDYYYILDVTPYYDYEQSLTLIDRKTGESTENVRPEGFGVNSVHIYRDETYIICAECIPEKEYDTLTSVTPLRAYRFHDGKYELIAENLINYAFSDGAFWYTPFEVEYYGTVMSPTGKGSETAPHDIIRNSGNTLTRVALTDGSTKTWTFDRFDEGFTPMFYGMSDGIAIVSMGSQKLFYETGAPTSTMHKYKLHDDGTVTDLGGYKK